MQLDLNTPERLARNWADLTPEQIAQLEAENVVTRQIEHNTNLNGRGELYTGQVQARSVWVHVESNEIIAEASPWQSAVVLPEHVFQTLATGISLSENAQGLLVMVNGGTMPNILPPTMLGDLQEGAQS